MKKVAREHARRNESSHDERIVEFAIPKNVHAILLGCIEGNAPAATQPIPALPNRCTRNFEHPWEGAIFNLGR